VGYGIYDIQLGGASDGGDYDGGDGVDDDDDGGGSGGGDDDDVGGGDGDGDGGDDDVGSIPSAPPREFDITGCGCTCAHGWTGGGAGPSPQPLPPPPESPAQPFRCHRRHTGWSENRLYRCRHVLSAVDRFPHYEFAGHETAEQS